jgi:hypothetical protein
MSNALDLAIEPLEALDVPSLSDVEKGIAVGLALVALGVAVAT